MPNPPPIREGSSSSSNEGDSVSSDSSSEGSFISSSSPGASGFSSDKDHSSTSVSSLENGEVRAIPGEPEAGFSLLFHCSILVVVPSFIQLAMNYAATDLASMEMFSKLVKPSLHQPPRLS